MPLAINPNFITLVSGSFFSKNFNNFFLFYLYDLNKFNSQPINLFFFNRLSDFLSKFFNKLKRHPFYKLSITTPSPLDLKFTSSTHLFSKSLYLLRFFFKYNKYFDFLSNYKITKFAKNFNKITFFKKFQTYFNLHPFLKNYQIILFRNWNQLVGGSLSQFDGNFINPKNWLLRSNIELNFKNSSKLDSNINPLFTNRKAMLKRIVYDFFYINKMGLDLQDTQYFIKFNTKIIKKNDVWDYSQPHQFLNTNYSNKYHLNFHNSLLIKLFNKYSKTLILFRKSYGIKKLSKYQFFKKFKVKTSNFHNHTLNNYRYSISYKPLFFLEYWNFKKKYLNKLLPIFFKKHHVKGTYTFYLLKHLFKSTFFKIFKTFRFRLLLNKKFKLKRFTILNFFKNHLFIVYKPNNPYCMKLTSLSLTPSLCLSRMAFIYTFNNIFYKNIIKAYSSITSLSDFSPSRRNFESPQDSNIYNKYKYIIFFTKEKNNFKTNKYGFIFLTDSFSFSNNLKLTINFKKIFYSFSFKNEMQKYILKRYIKVNFFSTMPYDVSSPKSIWEPNQDYLFPITSNNKTLLIRNFFNAGSFVSSYRRNYYDLDKLQQNWLTFNESEFNIKRIKFKPGYMNIWREAREVLKISLNLKFRYQHRLTKYLLKFRTFIKFKTFLSQEMSFCNIILKSKLLPDLPSIDLFVKNGLFFINGFSCMGLNQILHVGDFVQLVVTYKYYILYRWFLNWTIKKKNKLKIISKIKLHTPSNYEEKQRSESLPKWILSKKYLHYDIPNYLEVDYFTLSFFILYEPFLWLDINSYFFLNVKFPIMNIYNWKYLV